ncbi:MAG: hypothetical protein FWC92_05145 [Defluviitaleaceae bacterium]|nr:hypothetical protein [Defluviitaleaceae bacterium]
MHKVDTHIDYSDIPEITDFSKGRKNPHATKIKKEGYSVTVHYSPEDVASGQFDDTKDIIQALVELMPVADTKRLLTHIKEHYDLPCSPHVWDVLVEAHD